MSAEAGKPYEWGGLGDSPELTPEKIDAIVSDPAAFVEEVERWTEPREDGPMTLTLTDFLLARIAEDEAAARLCAEMFPSPWDVADRGWRVRIYAADIPDEGDHADPGDKRAPVVMEVEPDRNLDDPRWLSERVEHVRRHDPARVLAECAAKRLILRIWFESEFCERDVMNDVIDALALPYADHPDYREEWRP